MVKQKEKEFMFLPMDLITMVNSNTDNLMEKEDSFINSTEWLMKDNGEMESLMVKENNISQELEDIEDNSITDWSMVEEKWNGMMVDNTMEISTKAICTEKVF
jgi:hypothetical protein